MKHKNVIFITTDQQRADAMGEGYHTSNLDRLAREGISFTSHIVTSAQCTPSRASWMTGEYPHEVGVNIIGHMFHTSGTIILRMPFIAAAMKPFISANGI